MDRHHTHYLMTKRTALSEPSYIITVSCSQLNHPLHVPAVMMLLYGIPEYWIIDPALDQVKTYCLIDGRYGQASVLSLEANELLTTPLLPALSLPLATLFK